jgi:hypothetical protein
VSAGETERERERERERGREGPTVAESTLDLHRRRGVIYWTDGRCLTVGTHMWVLIPRCIGVSPRNNTTYALSVISPLSTFVIGKQWQKTIGERNTRSCLSVQLYNRSAIRPAQTFVCDMQPFLSSVVAPPLQLPRLLRQTFECAPRLSSQSSRR